MTTTFSRSGNHSGGRPLTEPGDDAAELVEERRVRLEALLQITAHDFELRLEFGNRDLLGDGQIVMRAAPAEVVGADYRALKGRALHLLGHYLSDARGWADAARRQEAARGKPDFAAVWHALEDARMENWLARRWPGMDKLFDAQLPLDDGPAARAVLVTPMPPREQVTLGLYLDGRGHTGVQYSPHVRFVLDVVSEAVEHGAHGDTPRATLEAARTIYPDVAELLGAAASRKGPWTSSQGGREERREGADDVGGDAASAPHDSDSLRTGADREAAKRPESGPLTFGAQKPRSERPDADSGAPEIEATGEVGSVSVVEREVEFPEWFRPGTAPWFQIDLGDKQVHPSAVRTDRQTIVEPVLGPPSRSDHATYRELWAEVQHEVDYLVPRLTGLVQSEPPLHYGGQYRSGKLNTAKLWKQRIGHYRLFQRRRRPISGHQNAALSVLVDESASMGGRAGGQDQCRMAMLSAVLLGETIDRLGVPFEIIGYTTAEYEARAAMRLGLTPAHEYATTRCSPLEHRIYKRFDESFRLVRTRLIGIEPRYNNWDEEHLMFAFRRLQARAEDTKIMLVISDGQPNGDANALIHQVDRLQRSGCTVIAIGIGQAPAHDFVHRVYANAVMVATASSDFRQLAEDLVLILRRELRRGRPVPEQAAAGGRGLEDGV